MKKLLSLAAIVPLHAGDIIVIKGSDTLGARLVPQLKEAFVAKNPRIDIPIAADVGFVPVK